MLEAEMKLLEKALRKSQKVYSIWFHRKWVVEQFFNACASEAEANRILDVELDLCSRLLEIDERNFHCWNHRAYVMGMMIMQQTAASLRLEHAEQAEEQPEVTSCAPTQVPSVADESSHVSASPEVTVVDGDIVDTSLARDSQPENSMGDESAPPADGGNTIATATEEANKTSRVDLVELDLKLSKDLINRNFSNYSAWHLRALLQQPTPASEASREEAAASSNSAGIDVGIDIGAELEWVQQGIYTEPNDQSIWLYHHWLTVLGRGHECLRITHCAVYAGELFVFFSGATCIHAKDGSDVPPASLTVCSDPDSNPDSTSVAAAVCGDMLPISNSTALRLRTRCLPDSRRIWTAAWKFKPRQSSDSLLKHFAPGNVQEIELTVLVEVLGNHATGAPAHGHHSLVFRGTPVVCAQSSECQLDLLPALQSILAPELEPSRSELLKAELERVEELLEIEPDCKWALLSQSRLAAACASGVEGARSVEEACSKTYLQMSTLDPLRRGFYDEAKATCSMRIRLISWMTSDSGGSLDLAGLSMRHLPPYLILAAFGVRVLDVSQNDLREFGPLLQLITLEELRASHNCLSGDVSEAFVLPRLRCLDVSSNRMELRENAMAPLPSTLTEVNISSNAAVLSLLAPVSTQAAGVSSAFEPPTRNDPIS